MNYDKINKVLDDDIVRIEAISRFRCPPENRKTPYTKACWLLAKYNAVIHLAMNEHERKNGLGAIKAIKELLPELRKNAE